MALTLKVLVGILAATSATLLYFLIYEFNPFLRHCNPDVCQSYALSAFKVHRVRHQGAGHCDYGVLPGFLTFNVMKPPGSRWQTAVGSCQLQNLLMPSADTGHVKVLLLGDSVDARLTKEWCIALEQPLYFTPTGIKRNAASFAAAIKAKAAGNSSASTGTVADAEECCKNRDVLYYCQPSKPGAAAAAEASISVGMFHLLGVHLDGPYHTGAKGNFLARIPLALATFQAALGGPPDLVVVHSNFWDQSRMWEQRQPGYGALNKLMPDVVFSWSSNFSLLLSTTTEQLPEDTLVATRTAAFPAFSANWLGRWHYIHQLNMAASEVTRLHGLPVIDLGGMVFGLEPREYLDDQHHPNKMVLLECANIAMNLLHQQRQRQAVEQLDMQSSSGSNSQLGTGQAQGSSTEHDAGSDPGEGSHVGQHSSSSSSSEKDNSESVIAGSDGTESGGDSSSDRATSDNSEQGNGSGSGSSSSSSDESKPAHPVEPGQRPAAAEPAEQQGAKQQKQASKAVERRAAATAGALPEAQGQQHKPDDKVKLQDGQSVQSG